MIHWHLDWKQRRKINMIYVYIVIVSQLLHSDNIQRVYAYVVSCVIYTCTCTTTKVMSLFCNQAGSFFLSATPHPRR